MPASVILDGDLGPRCLTLLFLCISGISACKARLRPVEERRVSSNSMTEMGGVAMGNGR